MDGLVRELPYFEYLKILTIFIFVLLVFGFSVMKIMLLPLFLVAALKVVFALMQGAGAWYNIGQIDIKEREEAAKKE